MSTFARRQRRELNLGIAIVVVLALGLAVSAAGYLRTSNAGLPDPPDAKPPPADSAAALVEPPGAPGPGGPFQLAALRSTVSLPQSVVDVLTTAGLRDAVRRTGLRADATTTLFALVTTDPAVVVAAYGQGMADQGLTTDRELSMRGVTVHRTPMGTAPARFGTAYVLYDRVVVVETTGPAETARDVFRTTLDRQIALAPPAGGS
ncbi:hypothetical protein [Amycolatopsis granulosa]|uniref:hypothetical protein n=1 Tax=Amycolatopsis granulosa TaxID=185684 RepID=UPI0014215ACC|nr:hypothetical protein [Amycolatopsis granulosa]NIH85139.1 hypothetical protein [Amycolatopsis granulosa]